jgi:hypothetical protein
MVSFRVSRKYTAAETNALMRAQWLQTRELGRTRFIRRQMLFTLLFWLTLMPALYWLGGHQPYSSVWSEIIADLILLPILLLGGYLEGRWRWTDLEKKYPADRLPPWE